jgi:hypothetical protein
MKGYIYITGTGVDPELRENMADPTFGTPPTLGACLPNVRRAAERGDWIFVVSGKIPDARQYIIGGIEVWEKIDGLRAYKRFPENRLAVRPDRRITGNVIVESDGGRGALDWHSPVRFQERARNFIVGRRCVLASGKRQISRARRETLSVLSLIMRTPQAGSAIEARGRMSRMDETQIKQLLDWFRHLKSNKSGCPHRPHAI